MNTIAELNPQEVWKNFYELTKIPRPSKKEQKAGKFAYEFGKKLGLETIMDEAGNVIIKKPATKGMEDRIGIILQGHLDMVPQKNSDVEFDFEKDAIQPRIVDGWVYATGTTLGADNGMGCAVAMAILESKNIAHGPIEALFTIDEETGMTGARALKPGVLDGKILINLDSETEGELYLGCAGGLNVFCEFKYKQVPVAKDYVAMALNCRGFLGGHSGMDIGLYRANTNKVLARMLLPLVEKCGAELVAIDGGNLRNAIPREAFSTVVLPKAKLAKAKKVLANVFAEVRNEYKATDVDAYYEFQPVALPKKAIEHAVAYNMLRAIAVCPSSVERMSKEMEGTVETSNNMAIVKSERGRILVTSLMRSFIDTAKEDLYQKVKGLFEMAGAKVWCSGGYSGWQPNMDSAILKVMQKVYKDLYNKDAAVMAVHAGLECGILGGTYPDWDMISCGPTICSPHSPNERVNIETVEKLWKFIVEVVKNAPRK